MLKRCLCILMVLTMLCAGTALAASVGAVSEELTDVPGVPTQESVISVGAALTSGEEFTGTVQAVVADELTMETQTEIYDFVQEEGNRPARYFPEDIQQDIEDMYEVDRDALFMTEFMQLHTENAEIPGDVEIIMQLDVDYQPGQLVVVVVGDRTDPEHITWYVLEAKATALGEITAVVPQSLAEQIEGYDVLYSVLTTRKGQRGGVIKKTSDEEPVSLPSKTAQDMIRVGELTDTSGNPLPEGFEILVSEETPVIEDEVDNIRAFIQPSEDSGEERKPIIQYFPSASQKFVSVLMGQDVDLNTLVSYEYVPLITANYQETSGDALAPFTFATQYQPGQKVAAILGLPLDGEPSAGTETHMAWYVQHATVNEKGEMEIVFTQVALAAMEHDTALMLIVSEPLEEASAAE